MAMVIKNNNAAMLALGELNKNTSALGKQLKKVSSGMRLTGAGDAPSDFSISEKMRVRIRALDQDERNVQNGASLLRVAEGGIQSQIEIMKTIKQKVIDADNDTNTDLDRMTIQKEIDQGYRQIEDIAWETNYNGKRLLVGDTVYETVRSWVVNGTSSLLPGSDEMNIINAVPDVYDTLNGVEGPFDVFQKSAIKSTSLASLGFSPTIEFAGGIDSIYKIDSSFTDVALLDRASFSVGYPLYKNYVLTTTPSSENLYGNLNGHIQADAIEVTNGVEEIDISGCTSVEDVMAAIAANVSVVTGSGTDYVTTTGNINWIKAIHYYSEVAGADPTGLVSGTVYFTGGQDESGNKDDDPDSSTYQPPVTASIELSGLSANKGITMYWPSGDDGVIFRGIRFVEGNSEPVYSGGVTTVGVDYSGSLGDQYYSFGTMDGGSITLYAPAGGAYYNTHCYVKDGIEEKTYDFMTTKPLMGATTTHYAYATVDVSGYTDVEALISDLKGKALTAGASNYYAQTNLFEAGYSYDSNYRGTAYSYIEFVDSGSSNPIDGMYKIQDSEVVDLNVLRTEVAGGKSIAKAFWDCCNSQTSSIYYLGARLAEATDSNGETVGIKIRAAGIGAEGNSEKLYLAQNNLRSYTLDYGAWFANNPDKANPDFLDGKGFRVYCATCDDQWFNFCFYTDDLPEGAHPNVDPESEDIKPIYIDVSNVTDAESLVQAIYDQAMPYLEGASEDYNHFMRLIADGDKLIVYDDRRYTDSHLKKVQDVSGDLLYDYQWDSNYNVGGAKIADGVWDNVVIGERDVYVKDLVIHHTDHASQNIHIKIPQTTMDHLFGYKAGTREWSEFNVMTAASREELLGNKVGYSRSGKYIAEDEEGLLDHALNYLTAANCLVGAQISRLEMTEANIVTSRESTTSSESTIRDADMAKEMTEYTKANVLAQAAQSMLAQANQDSSTILGLLQ